MCLDTLLYFCGWSKMKKQGYGHLRSCQRTERTYRVQFVVVIHIFPTFLSYFVLNGALT